MQHCTITHKHFTLIIYSTMKTCKLILIFISLTATAAASGAETLDILRRKADRLHAEGKNDSAITVAERALDIAMSHTDTTAIIGINSSMGVFLRTAGRLDDALKRYDTAMRICTTESFKRNADEEARQEAASLYLNMATLHVDMKHKDDALYYARLAADWAMKCTDKELKSQILAQDGLIFLMCGDNQEAARLLTMSYDTAIQLKSYAAAMNAGAYMIAVADRMGDSSATATWRARCVQLESKVTDTMTLVAYFQIQCSIAMGHEKWHEAIKLFNRILSTKGVDKMPFVVYDCYNNMHEVWAKLGEWRKAYYCQGRAAGLKDSLFEKDKAESLRELTVKYRTKEKELALARSEAELSRTRMYIATGALAALICALLVSLYVLRQRRRMREREAEFSRLKADVDKRLTRRYLEGLENERERLAKELHDGVCNNLYTLQIMARKADADGATLSEGLDGIRRQVRRISHELLPPEFKYADVGMVIADYVTTTAEATGLDITFDSYPDTADWSAISDSTALELYRITQEAVGNAVKHSGATSIYVKLYMNGTDTILSVTDNGTAAQKTGQGGIGRRTMRQRAEAAGGQLDINRHDGMTTLNVTVHTKEH